MNQVKQSRKSIQPATKAELLFLPLVPLKNVAVLPKGIIPIVATRQISIQAIEWALKNDRMIFLTTQKHRDDKNPTGDDVFSVGTKATILQVMRNKDGTINVVIECLHRIEMVSHEIIDDFIGAFCEQFETTNTQETPKLHALWRQLRRLYLTYTEFDEKASPEIIKTVKSNDDLEGCVDTIADQLQLTFPERMHLLREASLHKRISSLCDFIQQELEILKEERKIHGRVQQQIDKNQREYYLNEQIKAIHKELGRDTINDIESLKIKANALGLSDEAKEKVEEETKRLEQMPPISAEATVSRNYVDWLTSIPWNRTKKDTVSLTQAIKLLDKQHAGLQKVKDRIIEFVATKKFNPTIKRSPILCLVGPPGVGKTTLAKSICKSLGRDFIRISLGGVRDEAEIRGHRRTYIGAMPGKIIRAMKKARSTNPVILLDEIDKMAHDVHGDPSSALLEVLDHEQNTQFVDHYLDVEYDLSQVMFIATANVIEHIPYPLFDRLEMIYLSGYTEEEKTTIAQKFLLPHLLKDHGLTKRQFKLSQDLLKHVIDKYTRESGVRQLDRVLAKLIRKTIQVLLQDISTKSVTVTEKLILDWLGYPTNRKTTLNTAKKKIGLATGLAWTELGGDVLEIEASVLPGKGNVTLTGQLGEVMQESAQAALSYIRSRAKDLGIPPSFHTTKDIHIHMPEGATPKDGPSAGIAITTALISALTKKPVRNDIAMTGEITLQGRVLAIGGLKEKLLAAKQYNMNTVIVPQENYNDILEVKKEADLEPLNIVFAEHVDTIFKHAFVKNPLKKKK